MSERARAYIVYTHPDEDFPRVWCVDSRSTETQMELRAHLRQHMPEASFVGAIVVPDDPTPTPEEE